MENESPLERVNFENPGRARPSPPVRRPVRELASTDDLLGVLTDADRRRIVDHLRAGNGPAPLPDVVAEAFDSDDRPDAVTLHHVHLPKLTDADVATYDREADVIDAGRNAERAGHLLDAVGELLSGEFDASAEFSGSAGRASNSLAAACSTDESFRLLADETRRFVLAQLDAVERVHLDDLADRVAAWKAGKSVAALTDDQRRAARIELHQRHLPMLADAGVVAYDRDDRTLPRRGHPVAIAEWLAACPALESFETANGG